jgi:hypothetical protein
VATAYITHVRLEDGPGYGYDPHIGAVKLSDGTVETRQQVIYYIEQSKWTYYTYRPGYPNAKVVVAGCPKCGAGDYITTEPDWTPENNLLSLPRF